MRRGLRFTLRFSPGSDELRGVVELRGRGVVRGCEEFKSTMKDRSELWGRGK